MKLKIGEGMGYRIKKLREMLGLSQTEFAKKIFLSQSRLSEIERGKGRPSSSTIHAICKIFNVNKHWLYTGEGEIFTKPPERPLKKIEPSAQLVEIEELPVIAKVGAGYPLAKWDVEILYYIPTPAGRYPKNSFVVEVQGESMLPLLEEGDLAVCRPFKGYVTDIPNHKLVVVANEEGELMIKRLVKHFKVGPIPEKIWLMSDNPAFAPIELTNDYRIVGIVFEILKIKRLKV